MCSRKIGLKVERAKAYCQLAEYVDTVFPDLKFYESDVGKTVKSMEQDIDIARYVRLIGLSFHNLR